jgi:hypothetical protein
MFRAWILTLLLLLGFQAVAFSVHAGAHLAKDFGGASGEVQLSLDDEGCGLCGAYHSPARPSEPVLSVERVEFPPRLAERLVSYPAPLRLEAAISARGPPA